MSEQVLKINESQEQFVENFNVIVKSEPFNKKTIKSSKFSEFFDLVNEKDNISGVCKRCTKNKRVTKIKMKNRNTSGLKKHLSATHKNDFHKLFPEKVPSTNIANFFKSGPGPLAEFQAHEEIEVDVNGCLLGIQPCVSPNLRKPMMRIASSNTTLRPDESRICSNINRDEYQIFGDFVASELRTLRSLETRNRLKRIIQKAIFQVTEEEDAHILMVRRNRNKSTFSDSLIF